MGDEVVELRSRLDNVAISGAKSVLQVTRNEAAVANRSSSPVLCHFKRHNVGRSDQVVANRRQHT